MHINNGLHFLAIRLQIIVEVIIDDATMALIFSSSIPTPRKFLSQPIIHVAIELKYSLVMIKWGVNIGNISTYLVIY